MPISDLLSPSYDFSGINELLLPSENDNDLLAPSDEKEDRRKFRLSRCGKQVYLVRDQNTGKATPKLYRCDLPECEFCSKRRGNKAMTQIEKAVFEQQNIWTLETNNEQIHASIVRLGKDKYKSFPLSGEDETRKVFYSSDNPIPGSVPVTQEDIDLYDWTEIARKKPGKRTSGALGKTTNPENTGTVKIKVATSVIDCEDAKELYGIANEARQETITLDPHSQDELESANKARAELETSKARERGYTARIVYKTFRVNLSCIDWLSHIHDKFTYKTVNTPQPNLNQLEFASFSA